jgi:hypothetical protein
MDIPNIQFFQTINDLIIDNTTVFIEFINNKYEYDFIYEAVTVPPKGYYIYKLSKDFNNNTYLDYVDSKEDGL